MPKTAPKIDDPELIENLRDALRRGAMGWADSCRFMRASDGLTQAQFAKKVGVSLKVIKDLESGSGNPTLASLESIARFFGMRVGLVASPVTVQLGTAEVVRQRERDRSAALRDLKQGKTTSRKLHARNALHGSDFKVGLPKLS
jgi:transcriptional regulator with XRE-family HTH domain